MRSIFLIIALVLINISAHGADNVTVFSNSGYRFWVIVNGEKINNKPSEKVSFYKKSGAYKLRVIIDNRDNENINDQTDSPVEIKDNYEHLFEVSVDALFAGEFPNSNKEKTVTIKKYALVNTAIFSGKWKLTINYTKIDEVKIEILDNGILTETVNINITGKDGNAYMSGTLDRTRNVIYINTVTERFYDHIKYNLGITNNKPYRCDWFYYSFNTTFSNAGVKKYATPPSLFYYYLTNNWVVCDNKDINSYDKYNIQLNMALER